MKTYNIDVISDEYCVTSVNIYRQDVGCFKHCIHLNGVKAEIIKMLLEGNKPVDIAKHLLKKYKGLCIGLLTLIVVIKIIRRDKVDYGTY